MPNDEVQAAIDGLATYVWQGELDPEVFGWAKTLAQCVKQLEAENERLEAFHIKLEIEQAEKLGMTEEIYQRQNERFNRLVDERVAVDKQLASAEAAIAEALEYWFPGDAHVEGKSKFIKHRKKYPKEQPDAD